MAKIAMIGAGSVVFASRLATDILSWPALQDSTIALMDIDPGRLDDGDRLRPAARRAGEAADESRVDARPPRGARRRRLRRRHDPGRRPRRCTSRTS